MAQQRNAYSMALQASVAAEQPIVVREQQQFIDAEDEAVWIEPVAITGINVDVPTAAIGVFIGEEIEIAVDLVDCLVEFGSDRLSFVEGQRRSQQFHAGEAAFRPIQWVQPILRNHIKAGTLRGFGGGRPCSPCPLAQF